MFVLVSLHVLVSLCVYECACMYVWGLCGLCVCVLAHGILLFFE